MYVCMYAWMCVCTFQKNITRCTQFYESFHKCDKRSFIIFTTCLSKAICSASIFRWNIEGYSLGFSNVIFLRLIIVHI